MKKCKTCEHFSIINVGGEYQDDIGECFAPIPIWAVYPCRNHERLVYELEGLNCPAYKKEEE